ncbi:MAG: YccF domain-containing protein [Cyclobacteriaceae bacterium]
MSSIGNILWFFLGGFLTALFYLFGSFILIITIIGIPFGIQTLKLAGFALAPFGNEVSTDTSSGLLSLILNIIWILFAGIELAIIHLVLALIFGITIIGIPFAVQHLKMANLALVPFGRHAKAGL